MGLFKELKGIASNIVGDAKIHEANIKMWKSIKKDNVVMLSDALRGGAEINNRNRFGNTPLMEAVRISHVLVNLLVERGAGLDLVDGNGQSALMIALQATNTIEMSERIQMLKILLSKGASMLIVDNYGQSAREIALTDEVRNVLDDFSGLAVLKRSQNLAIEKSESVEEIIKGLNSDLKEKD